MTPQLAIILTIAAMISILGYVFRIATRPVRYEIERTEADNAECPWPLRHSELAERPDWVAELKLSHSKTNSSEGQARS